MLTRRRDQENKDNANVIVLDLRFRQVTTTCRYWSLWTSHKDKQNKERTSLSRLLFFCYALLVWILAIVWACRRNKNT